MALGLKRFDAPLLRCPGMAKQKVGNPTSRGKFCQVFFPKYGLKNEPCLENYDVTQLVIVLTEANVDQPISHDQTPYDGKHSSRSSN